MKSTGYEVSRSLLLLLSLAVFGGLASSSVSAQAIGDSQVILETNDPFSVTSTVTRVALKPVGSDGLKSLLATRSNELSAGRRLYLIVEELQSSDQPGVLYWLYLDLPAGEKPKGKESEYAIGVFTLISSIAKE